MKLGLSKDECGNQAAGRRRCEKPPCSGEFHGRGGVLSLKLTRSALQNGMRKLCC